MDESMDDLALAFYEKPHANQTTARKRRSVPIKCFTSPDDGIDMNDYSDKDDDYDPMNDSIAGRVKNRINRNEKVFDSGYFYDKVIDQIAIKVNFIKCLNKEIYQFIIYLLILSIETLVKKMIHS